MTDERADDTRAASPEEAVILQALRSLEAPDLVGIRELVREGDDAEGTLLRLYTEVLGLVPYELAPTPPPPALRGRILAAVAGDETLVVPAMQPPPSGAWRLPEGGPASRPPSGVHPLPPRTVVRAPRWLGLLAATLAVTAIGLGAAAASLWQRLEVERRRAEVHRETAERLAGELAAAEESLELTASERAGELRDARLDLALVTAPTTEVLALRPPPRQAPLPQARGLLYVAADHQHWYLRVEGLQPLAGEQVYQLWFVTDGGTHSGGSLEPGPALEAELSSPEMPAGTRAAFVTLEPAADGSAPRGPVVVFGDELQRLI